MTAEEWRPIPGYEDFYEVSNLGNVRSIDRVVLQMRINRATPISMRLKGRVLVTQLRRGRRHVSLSVDDKVKRRTVYSLVANAFLGGAKEGMVVCHNNGNPSDDRLENLRWDTHAGNSADMILHGTLVCGSRVWRAKFSEADIITIRQRLKMGDSHKMIASEYGVRNSAIWKIDHGKTWKSVK